MKKNRTRAEREQFHRNLIQAVVWALCIGVLLIAFGGALR